MSQLGKWYRYFIRYEWILFYSLILLNTIPAFQPLFFPSVDGPIHIYNANVILKLLSGSEFLSQYYTFNTWIVPNWTGHFIMAGLLSVFSATVASQIFIGLCLILLPVSFRYCVKKIHKTGFFVTYLIFPFTYTFVLCMGFYNFYIGIIILFLTVGILFEYCKFPFRMNLFFSLCLLILLCYLTHLFLFISLGMIALCILFLDVILIVFNKGDIKLILKKVLFLFFAFVIPVILTVIFFDHVPKGNKFYLLKSELLQWITNCRSLICYVPQDEVMYTTYEFLIFMLLFSIAIYIRGVQFYKNVIGMRSFFLAFRPQDTFLVMLLAFIYLYFKLPDSDSLTGFVSVRLNLMIYLFLILWCSGFNYPKWISAISFSVLLFSQINLLALHSIVFKSLNKDIAEVIVIEEQIKENTLILPLDYSGNWVMGHYSNYLGITKPVVILKNHECSNSYFPLKWKHGKVMKNFEEKDKLREILENANLKSLPHIDYIFVNGKTTFPDSLFSEILKWFYLKKETKNLLLFENRQR
jgi:hypothetical protein